MAPEESEAIVSQLMQISRGMMRIYKEMLGRGPDRAQTHYAGPNAIVCFLEGTLTPVERTLTTIAAHRQLRDTRTLIQDAAAPAMRVLIEQVTGRSVIAATSGFDVMADVVTEAFRLAPVPPAASA